MEILNLILADYTLRVVALGSALLGIISGVLGSYAVIRKESLLGDAVSHAALPGIATVFILTGSKQTETLLLGALISGLIASFLIILIERYSRIKFDSGLGLILSVFFGIGMVLMTYIQKTPNAKQAGLDSFIYGQASTLLKRDVKMMAWVGAVLIFLVVLFWKEFLLISFDEDYAESLGFSSRKLTFLLSTMIVASIIIGLQTVGVILMSAMLTAPAVAARQWTDKFSVMMVLSAFFGGISGLVGTIASSLVNNLPTGPTIVLSISSIVIVSLTLAPKRGLIWKAFKERSQHRNISQDKILLNLYSLALNHGGREHSHDIYTIKPSRARDRKSLEAIRLSLNRLEDRGHAGRDASDQWFITDEGIEYIEKNFTKEEG